MSVFYEYNNANLAFFYILHSLRHKSDLEEAASAYKDIDEVMKNQEDLVDIVVELQPLAVLKG